MKRFLKLLIVAILATLITSCSQEPDKPVEAALPIVNDENCVHEEILKLKDKEKMMQFSSLCLRRGSFKRSSGKTWTVKDAE